MATIKKEKKTTKKAAATVDSKKVSAESARKEEGAPKPPKPVKKEAEAPKRARRYFEAIGRRKTATCRARLFTARPLDEYEGRITVNGKSYKEYFPTSELQQIVEASLNKLKSLNRFEISAKVWGGGIKAQAEAIRHGIARTLVLFNPDFRKKLKRADFLRRDPRMKERKKYGLKKARRAPQWSKR
ncbi:MAG: 30S ribosomal protein S9 [Candidatus Portnoybacteria bacterium]|nr:30S ribosomal protein S9 [Candidatus Portnoybacteria bacterium]